MPPALAKLQSAVAQVKQANLLKPTQLEDSPTIKVCVRVRPFIKEEVDGQRSGGECKLCIDMPSETQVRILNFEDPDDDSRAFEFDRCYWSFSREHQFFATQETLQTELGETMTHLVDLAGSERAGRTKATGDRLKEGAAINQSLSTLARVISELAKSAKSKKKPNPPFRESKLTYILKESLCGNSKTVMMAAISPNFMDYDETLSTLKFAHSVKQVQTKAVQNAVNMSSVEAQLRAELNSLKSQLQAYQDSVGSDELGFLKRRLEEQEQLCAYYGKDWDSLLAEERSRMDERRTSLHPSALPLKRVKEDERQKVLGTESASSDEDVEDDAESFTCSLLMLGPSEEVPPAGRNSLCAPIRSSLAVVGPMAQQLKQTRRPELQRELDELSQVAKETEKLVNGEHTTGLVSLKVLVVVDPDERSLQAGLVVQASASTALPSSWAWCGDEEQSIDWCSKKELQDRFEWLKANRQTSAPPETWLAAARATGPKKLEQLQEENAELERRLAELQARLRGMEGGAPELSNKENGSVNLRQQKAREAVKAISASFATAIGALDAAQLALSKR